MSDYSITEPICGYGVPVEYPTLVEMGYNPDDMSPEEFLTEKGISFARAGDEDFIELYFLVEPDSPRNVVREIEEYIEKYNLPLYVDDFELVQDLYIH